MRPVRAIDLFCGAGGSSWGAARSGAEVVAGFDRWDLAARTFAANHPGAWVFQDDLLALDPTGLRSALGPIDLLLASPECTNHGPAKGRRERCEVSRGTAMVVPRFAEALGPRWIIIENVTAMRHWDRYAELIGSLHRLGYRISEHALDASEFGVPQARRRLYILCDREAEPRFAPPRHRVVRTARDFIEMNGRFEWSPLRTPRRAQPTLERADRAIAAVGPSQPFLLVYYGTDHAGGWQQLQAPLRTITTLDRFAVVKPTRQGHMMRMLQVPELKQAMGMPASFKTPFGTRREQIMLLGNGVCPPVMRHLVRNLTR